MPKLQYPRYKIPNGPIVYCIAWAIDNFRSGWEWIATDIVQVTDTDTMYYGYVKSDKIEFKTFYKSYLERQGMTIYTDKERLRSIVPPKGWKRLPDLEEE